jgi:hypothetical protein
VSEVARRCALIPVLNFPGGDLGQGGKAKILPKHQ